MRSACLASLALLLLILPLGAEDSSRTGAISIRDAEKAALANATDLRLSFLRSRAAIRAYRFGVRDLLPSLSFEIDESQSVVMNAPDSAAKIWSITIGQPVFSGGRVLRQRALSAIQLALQARDYADQQDSLLDTVHELYYRVLVQKEKLSIQHDVRRTTKEQVRIARTEREIGDILEVDLLDAELELSSIDLEIRAAETLLEEYEYQLKQVLGMDPDELLRLEGGIDTDYAGIVLPRDKDFFFKIAAENNTDLKKQDLEIRKAREQLRSLQSWYLPDIDLEVTLYASGVRYPLQDPGLSGKLNLSFPLRPFPLSSSISAGGTPGKSLNLGRTAGVGFLQDIGYWTDRTVGILAYQESQIKRENLSENLEFDIYKAIARYEQSKNAVELKRRNIELMAKKVFIMERQVELGGIKRIDYLQAQTQLAREKSGLVEQVLQVLDDERAFERLLGVRAGELKRIVEGYQGKDLK
jgi:outer membrane protein TolC